MRSTSQPLLAVIWDAAILADSDDWLTARLGDLTRRKVVLASRGGPGPEGFAQEFGQTPDKAGFASMAETLGFEPGAVMFIGANNAEVNAAASAGMRSFRYSRLARDVLARRLIV